LQVSLQNQQAALVQRAHPFAVRLFDSRSAGCLVSSYNYILKVNMLIKAAQLHGVAAGLPEESQAPTPQGSPPVHQKKDFK
jgi:hypothetical protein